MHEFISFWTLASGSAPHVVTDKAQQFEIDPVWVPRPDVPAGFVHIKISANDLSRFERSPFYAAKVLIASSVGSQLFLFDISAIWLIPLRALRDIVPGDTRWISHPIKDSNPLRIRDRHQFGKLIAVPGIRRRSYAEWPRSTFRRQEDLFPIARGKGFAPEPMIY